MNRIVTVVVAAVLGFALYAYDDANYSADHTSDIDVTGSPEARQWLRNNESDSALASNRFGATSEAVQFVNGLYAAGAERVVVPEDAIEDDGIEAYADSLVVVLPHDSEKRRRVRAICEREIRNEGFDPSEDGGGDQIFLWWD